MCSACVEGVKCVVWGVFSVLDMRMWSVCDMCCGCLLCAYYVSCVYVFYERICCVSVVSFVAYLRCVSVFCKYCVCALPVCEYVSVHAVGFPGSAGDKEPTCKGRKCKRCGFDPLSAGPPGEGNGN